MHIHLIWMTIAGINTHCFLVWLSTLLRLIGELPQKKLFSSKTRKPLFINMYLSLLFLLKVIHNWLHSQLMPKSRKRSQNKWLGKFKDRISVVKLLTQAEMLAVFKSVLPVKDWLCCSPLSSAKCVKYLPACISSLFLQYLQSGKSPRTWLLILNTGKGTVST